MNLEVRGEVIVFASQSVVVGLQVRLSREDEGLHVADAHYITPSSLPLLSSRS